MKSCKSFFILAHASEGHGEKKNNALLAETFVVLQHRLNKTLWVFLPAVTLKRPFFISHISQKLLTIRRKEQRKHITMYDLTCACDLLHDPVCPSHSLTSSVIHRFITKTQQHSLVSAEYRTRICWQLRWGVLWCQRLVLHFISLIYLHLLDLRISVCFMSIYIVILFCQLCVPARMKI